MARFLSALSHKVALGVRRPGAGREGGRERGWGASKQPGGTGEEAGGAHHMLLVKGIREWCRRGDTALHLRARQWGWGDAAPGGEATTC